MAERSLIVSIGFFALIVFFLPYEAKAGRCDRQVTLYAWNRCLECSINAFFRCPSGYRTLTNGEGVQRCTYLVNFGTNFGHIGVPGCQHLCSRSATQPECCGGFWGRDCRACPGVSPCSGRGSCSDTIGGNGTCACLDGFKGFACELCKDTNKFGSYCNETCPCLHGECDSGVNGTGHCKPDSCHLGFMGQDCDISLPDCLKNLRCGANAGCFRINDTDTCVCNPGYKNVSSTCVAINHCLDNTHSCHSNAVCSFLGPGKHNCSCAAGYTGDGTVCVAVDPCQWNNGGCPSNSTDCNYVGPGKSNCSCLPGFQNFTSGAGCVITNLCENGGGCDVNANCTMEGPGVKRCDCKFGYRGNGTTCFGSILQRIKELNMGGPSGLKGNLTTAIDLLTGSFVHRALSGPGPFTLFLMVDTAFANLTQEQRSELTANIDMAAHFVSRHLIAGDLNSVALKKYGTVTTLQGIYASITEYQNVTYFRLMGHYVNASVLFPDLLAGNGIIHVIDKIMWHVGDYQETSSKSSLEVLYGESRFSIFASILQSSGVATELSAVGAQFTLLVPVNSAFDKIDNSTMRFLQDTDEVIFNNVQRQALILEDMNLVNTEEGMIMHCKALKPTFWLLRDAVHDLKILKADLHGKKEDEITFEKPHSNWQVLDLIYSGSIVSVEGESLMVTITLRGQIDLNKDANVIESNILTNDGVLHVSNSLLIPDDIEPLLPRYCNRKIYSRGICYRCTAVQAMPGLGCPRGYSPSNTTRRCLYRLYYHTFLIGTFVGCRASTCSAEVPECCAGYYGRPCHPCPGPFGDACNGNGKCVDKIIGNGTCICQPNFEGTACELCEQDDKFGPYCNQSCTCLHGSCDTGPKGNGTCVPRTCLSGFHGINCDQRDVPCRDGSFSRRCHVFASCVRQGNIDSCQCNAGYEGSGMQCSEIDPCSKPSRGGCHHEAICTKTGPGTNNCTCGDGFRGDGVTCVAIDPCQVDGAGYCHSNADCQYIGPGQSICVCKAGYTGNGSLCDEINPCLVNNGGCSADARCLRTGPGKHNCSCNSGFIGNGYFCLGSVATIIGRMNPNLENYIRRANLLHYLSDQIRNLTLFAPSNLALSQFPDAERKYWTNSTERLEYLIRYHLVDQSYSLKDLKSKSAITASNGLILNITMQGQSVVIGQSARIVRPNVTAENGFVHVIDKVLVPPRLSYESRLPSTSELLRNVSEFSDFYDILKRLQLLSSLDACASCTVFAPTNAALKKNAVNLTADIVKYHVVKHYLAAETVRNGEEYSSWRGDHYLVKITKSTGGMLKVNGIDVVRKGQKARRAMVFGLNGVLNPVKRNCDETKITRVLGSCVYCLIMNPTCPAGYTKIGVRQNSCWITFIFVTFRGCRAICRKTTTTKKCCSGFWGPDCQSCPGNFTSPCSSNGNCDDGKSGTGHCQCTANFTGTACEKCIPGKYGANCSMECKCINGVCNEGVNGDGACLCHHGWKGRLCNVSANYANCLPTVCSSHATCRGPTGSGRCECDAGYTGNGTQCAAIDTCVVNNGGCHPNATCSIDISQPGFRSCMCNKDFTGDGQVCIGIDPCQTNNGDCHSNATCVSIGPGKRNCLCKKDFSGDGEKSCVGINPCELDNGGCSDRADCTHVGPHQRRCVCRREYVGDGFTCIGDIAEALRLDPQLSEMNRLLIKHGLDKLLGSHGYFNLLAPVNTALTNSQSSRRKRRNVNSPENQEEMLLKYHIIGCTRMSFNGASADFTSLLGPRITVKTEGNVTSLSDSYGNVSRIVGAYEASNGVILKLDSALSPPSPSVSSPKGSFADVANMLGYKEFVKLVELAGLRNRLDIQFNRPLLMFWPTDNAISAIPMDIMTKLRDPKHLSDLIHFVQYHVVTRVQSDFSTQSVLKSGAGLELKTLGRSSLFVSCKGLQGDLYVNGESKLVQRDVMFDGGFAFGVDKALMPLGFGGNCDEIQEVHIKGQCGNCFVPVSCPQGASLVGTTNHDCTYSGDLLGCQPICAQRQKVRKCCANFYGPDCLACPGGIQLPCSRRGQCLDGLQGNGKCVCDSAYNGTACERCVDSSGSCPAPSVDCNADNGGCHVFATCSQVAANQVRCSCKPGYHGDGYYCQMNDVCTTSNGGCDVNANCLFTGPGTRRCQCKAGFYPVGSTCQPHAPNSPCAQNHGGCSVHASCADSGNGVTCVCRPGFVGDGFTCEGTIIEVLLATGNATEFYKVLYQMSMNLPEALSLYEELQKSGNNFTVFVPVNSAVVPKKFTMHVLRNHILLGRLSLNNLIGDVFVTSLAGTNLLIRKLPNGQVLVNGVAHVIGDIPAVNGLVRMIDQMIPAVGSPSPTTGRPTGEPTVRQTTEPEISSTTKTSTTVGSSLPDINANARKQDNNSVGRGAIAGIIIGIIMIVLLIGLVLWLVKKKSFPSRTFYKKNVDTVQFSNEAYTGSGISFDNELYDNLDSDPVLMQPLDFPIDDKQPLPEVYSPEHLEFDNPLFREMMGLPTLQRSKDPFFRRDTNQALSPEHLDFHNPGYGEMMGLDNRPNGGLEKNDLNQVSSEHGVREFANPMYANNSAQKTDLKLNLGSDNLPSEDTC